MAQWSRADRTLYAKVVFYGPAFGGKTTNLQSLHTLTDPQNKQKLLSIKTADDRTLFFDLLPFDLGDILGYQVAMKLYTVPGQVRYDTTRQVVLGGADAVVFVADSSRSRQEQNVWSLQNLQMNMRAKGLDPARVPVLYQFNKQDLPEAAPPEEVARWLGIPVHEGFPAVAVDGRGVLETFMAASRKMLEKLISAADERTRSKIDAAQLDRHIDSAFAPYRARLADAAQPDEEPEVFAGGENELPVILRGNDLLERAVQTGVRLGEKLTRESARAGRLEQEAEAFRRLSESLRTVGASFDRASIVDAALEAASQILDAPLTCLVHEPVSGNPQLDRAWGREEDPLLTFEDGIDLLSRMISAGGPCVVDDLSAECSGTDAAIRLKGLRAVVAVPVEPATRRVLVAYAPQPDGMFREADVRFLVTVAGHLAVGLEKARLHDELAAHRDRLEETVAERTKQLREAYESLRAMDATKDRFLNNLSHEMKTPLTAMLSSAVVLRDYDSEPEERRELAGGIVDCGEALTGLLDNLFRLANLTADPKPPNREPVQAERLLAEALELAGAPRVECDLDETLDPLEIETASLSRALANLIDNAVKFSPPSCPVDVRVRREASGGGVSVAVLDRGAGVPPADRERIFAPFEQGGDDLTSKPAGIGLGLHEARTIVEAHGGTLDYHERDGGGSEFRVNLPVPQELPLPVGVGAADPGTRT